MTLDNLLTDALSIVSDRISQTDRVAAVFKQEREDRAVYDQIWADAQCERPKPGTSYRERMGIQDPPAR